MSWLRVAMYWWAGPDGTLTSAEGAEGHAMEAYETLVKMEMAETMPAKPTFDDGKYGPEVKYKGKSGDEAKFEAQQRLIDKGITPGSNAAMRSLIDDHGYVAVSDSHMGGANYWASARSADDLAKAEDGVLNFVSKGPLGVTLNDGASFIITPEALAAANEEGRDFSQVVQDAMRAKTQGSVKGIQGWGSPIARVIRFFK